MSATPDVIRTEGLAVGFQGRPVVSDIDISLQQGMSIALVGTNGSGKSTLLKTLVGLLAPISGTINVLGEPPGSTPRRIGYLGQFHAAGGLLPLQARDVVMMGRYPRRGLLGRITHADREVVVRSMERMGVADLAGQPLRSMSGGQQQRVYIAQVLAREADLLILDEPTAGLDAGSAERYLQVVQEELERGASVATATHDIGEAMSFDLAILLAGRVIAYGLPRDVLNADHLLEAFGIALRGIPHDGHQDLLSPQDPHGH